LELNLIVSAEKKSLSAFTELKGLAFKKLGYQDVAYKLVDVNNIIKGYAEVYVLETTIRQAFPLKILARKLIKLVDKRINSVIIWGCYDGILYINPQKIKGDIKWDKESEDLIITFNNRKDFKYVKF